MFAVPVLVQCPCREEATCVSVDSKTDPSENASHISCIMPPITVRTVPEPAFKCIHPHSVRTGRAAKRALSAPSPASGNRALDSSTRANTQHASGCRAGTGDRATSKTSCRLSEMCRGDRENRRPAIPVNGKMWRSTARPRYTQTTSTRGTTNQTQDPEETNHTYSSAQDSDVITNTRNESNDGKSNNASQSESTPCIILTNNRVAGLRRRLYKNPKVTAPIRSPIRSQSRSRNPNPNPNRRQ